MSDPEASESLWARVFGNPRVPPEVQEAVEALSEEMLQLRHALDAADEQNTDMRAELEASQLRESDGLAAVTSTHRAMQAQLRQERDVYQEQQLTQTEQWIAERGALEKEIATNNQHLVALANEGRSLRATLKSLRATASEHDSALCAERKKREQAAAKAAICEGRVARVLSEQAETQGNAELLGKIASRCLLAMSDIGVFLGPAFELALRHRSAVAHEHDTAAQPRLSGGAASDLMRKFAPPVFAAAHRSSSAPMSAEAILEFILTEGPAPRPGSTSLRTSESTPTKDTHQ